MRSVLSLTLLLLLLLSAEANKRNKSHRGKHERPPSDCPPAETQFGRCVPEQGDCGAGLRDASCRERTDKIPCRVPCNWKKDISDCKYRFGPWSSCDVVSNTKTRSGSLKRAMFNAECQTTVTVHKPCSPRQRKSRGEKKTD